MKQIYEYDMLFNYDFLLPSIKATRYGLYIFLDFKSRSSQHLMIRGGKAYAMYDYRTGLWTKDMGVMIEIFDEIVMDLTSKFNEEHTEQAHPLLFSVSSSHQMDAWNHYHKNQQWDNWRPLDEKVIFQNTEVVREDYATFRLPYALEEGSVDNYLNMFTPLYSPEEFRKLEWVTGAILTGAAKRLQKMLVIFGSGGTGKSTWLDLQKDYLFSWEGVDSSKKNGYASDVKVKDLCSNKDFGLEPMKDGPLISIDDDVKLDKIEDSTLLNSVVSHASIPVNTKYCAIYSQRFNTFICMGTNSPVQINDAKSGLLRRIIDVVPTGNKHPFKTYMKYLNGMRYEIGAIAYRCIKIFNELGEDYYEDYVPVRMMAATNYFYDFIDYNYNWFNGQRYILLSEAWKRYQDYVTQSALKYSLNRLMVKNQLMDYFNVYKKETHVDGKHVYDYYSGFKYWKFEYSKKEELNDERSVEFKKEDEDAIVNGGSWLKFNKTESLLDSYCFNCPAQPAGKNEKPIIPWDLVSTVLSDIDTHKLHYVKVPKNLIVIDFDLKDESGQKSFLLNWKAASQWPDTYAELSKGGAGIHLHYLYPGDVDALDRLFSKDIEVKVFKGGASLRRKVSKCNDIPIATLTSGLRLREVKKTVNWDGVKNERMLRRMIAKNLLKEYHANTKPSVDYIYDLLQQAYESGLHYDVSDLEPSVVQFAAKSHHQSTYCLKKCTEMKFKSDDISPNNDDGLEDDRVIFFDIEVFPNLFVVNWKVRGVGEVHRMINPTSRDVEGLFKYKLVGFNNRKYDNHILWAASMGYTTQELFNLSQKIIIEHTGFFGEAYNLSYTDVYDFASAGHKKSLKKFEIELGIHHQELGLRWDQPVSEDLWDMVAEYCDNDVIATEAVFEHLSGDWIARQILAELSGLTVNDTTNQHSTKIIFGNDPNPKAQFVYTDLSTMFPGYTFKWDDDKKRYISNYRGEDPGEGGYVYAEPGMYTNTVVLDVASMHPSSIEALDLFGPVYTKRFVDIKNARVLIKHGDFDKARVILDGKLSPYLTDKSKAADLSNALKTVINSVYGLTSAKFDNKFRDPRNIDNIVAKRGALFMINLKHEVQGRGYTVAHIKTDSIKIPNATPEIIDFVMKYGKEYGYTFEHESTYEKICLVNNAVYIAKYADPDKCNSMYRYIPSHNKDAFESGELWDATGAQFAQPYVFKTLFSHEALEFKDYTETKSTTSALYLDMNEDLPDVSKAEHELDILKKKWRKQVVSDPTVDLSSEFDSDESIARDRDSLKDKIATGHDYKFVGRVGNFIPVKRGGGFLMRQDGDSYAFATGSRGHRWIESEVYDYENLGDSNIDTSYHSELVNDAVDTMAKFGDVEWFLSDDISPEPLADFMNIPYLEGVPIEEIPFM